MGWSNNPRQFRALARSRIEGLRNRKVPYLAASSAVRLALQTEKGRRAGLEEALAAAAGHQAVAGMGEIYSPETWPENTNPTRVNVKFISAAGMKVLEPVDAGSDHSWEVVRDELAVRGYGIHDAEHGATPDGGVVAVVLDRQMRSSDLDDLFYVYGLEGLSESTTLNR
jgi:hypothetical protein